MRIFFFFAFFSICILQQSNGQFLNVVFDSSGNVLAEDIFVLPDNNLLLTGTNSPAGFPYHDGCLIKLDPEGNILWDREYHGNLWRHQLTNVVVDSLRSHYVLIGHSNDTVRQTICMLITDTSGQLIDAKLFADSAGREYMILKSYTTIGTSDGNVCISDYVYDGTGGGMFLMKCDLLGNVLWTKILDDPNYLLANSCMAIQETADHGFVTTGNLIVLGSGGQHTEVSRFDSSGNLIWHMAFSMTDYAIHPQHIIVLPGDDILISGYLQDFLTGNTYYGFLLKMDSTGNVESSSQYSSTAGCGMGTMTLLPSGNILMNATVKVLPGSIPAFLLLDTAGNILNVVTLDDPADDSFTSTIKLFSDGSHAILGERSAFDSTYRYMTLILKTDSLNSPPCFGDSVSIVQTPLILNKDSIPVSYKNVTVFTIPDTLTESSHLNMMVYCSSTTINETYSRPAEFLVTPNPFNSKIEIHAGSYKGSMLRIFNSIGQNIFSKMIYQEIEELDVSALNSGIYFMSIEGYSVKLIKE
jgi:hypothetical protein